MTTWIDIPEVQLLAVIMTGLAIGYVWLPSLVQKPFRFVLISGLAFFGIRFAPAYLSIDTTHPGAIPGNGIVAAAVMWVIYFAAMLLGDFFARRRFLRDGTTENKGQ